ncbi:MAG: L-seryl-tRNA(Sec) selenium transferase [Acidobacteriota bacterium]|nr:L-seryl-tRNA(Sec) selenium transferase [Acidobacteriota bacterium]
MTPRDLPSVDQLLRKLEPLDGIPRELLKNEIRAVLSEQREVLKSGEPTDSSIEETVRDRLQTLTISSLKHVINATGVVLHTNLGRAPLPAFDPIAGYSNLEYDLESGKRGKRDYHLSPLLKQLLGKSAIVVNNNAAAVYLVLNELAFGGEVIVSRGELIEIGDGFRIPDIMTRAGVTLREVGTTNRTGIGDYERAITDKTRLILRVHPSNFHVSGFTARARLEELAALGKKRNIPVYEDLGSGCLVDLRAQGITEPLAKDSLAAGLNVISFSCDKLLGGPQAGIIAGDTDLLKRIRRNPMYRAFRVDKLIIQSLQTTLRHLLLENWQQIPALQMICASPEEIRERTERLAARIDGIPHRLRASSSVIGGGSTPDQSLPTWIIELTVPDAAIFERRLRTGRTPVVARIESNKLILDLRTVFSDEEPELIGALSTAADERLLCE